MSKTKDKILDDVDPKMIHVTGWNPRKSFPAGEKADLKESIKAEGIKERLKVRASRAKGFVYDLVDGERRLQVAKELKIKVPIIIVPADDKEVKLSMALTFFQKKGINAIEEAHAVKMLLEDEPDQVALGAKIGKSQGWISNRIRLLELPDVVQKMFISGKITAKHGIQLLSIKDLKGPYKETISYLNTCFKEDEIPSVSDLRRKVGFNIRNAFSNIEDLPHHHVIKGVYYYSNDYGKHFNKVGCQECKDVFVFQEKKYCTNGRCFNKKILEAHAKTEAKEKKKKSNKGTTTSEYVEKVQAQQRKALDAGKVSKDLGKVDEKRLNSSDYENLDMGGLTKAQKKNCDKCESRVNTKKGYVACINPSCFRSMVNKAKRTKKLLERENHRRSLEALQLFLDDTEGRITDSILTRACEYFLNKLNDIQPLLCLEPWDVPIKKKQQWGNDYYDFKGMISDYPYDEKLKILVRALIFSDNASYKDSLLHPNHIEKHVNGFSKYLKRTTPDKKLAHIKKKETHKAALCGFPPELYTLQEHIEEVPEADLHLYCRSCLDKAGVKIIPIPASTKEINKKGKKTPSGSPKKGKKPKTSLDFDEIPPDVNDHSLDAANYQDPGIRKALKEGKIKPKAGGGFTTPDPKLEDIIGEDVMKKDPVIHIIEEEVEGEAFGFCGTEVPDWIPGGDHGKVDGRVTREQVPEYRQTLQEDSENNLLFCDICYEIYDNDNAADHGGLSQEVHVILTESNKKAICGFPNAPTPLLWKDINRIPEGFKLCPDCDKLVDVSHRVLDGESEATACGIDIVDVDEDCLSYVQKWEETQCPGCLVHQLEPEGDEMIHIKENQSRRKAACGHKSTRGEKMHYILPVELKDYLNKQSLCGPCTIATIPPWVFLRNHEDEEVIFKFPCRQCGDMNAFYLKEEYFAVGQEVVCEGCGREHLIEKIDEEVQAIEVIVNDEPDQEDEPEKTTTEEDKKALEEMKDFFEEICKSREGPYEHTLVTMEGELGKEAQKRPAIWLECDKCGMKERYPRAYYNKETADSTKHRLRRPGCVVEDRDKK